MSSFILPTNDKDKKRIRDCMEEISNSYTRQAAERSFIKEAIEALSEDVDIPKKILAKAARVYYQQNMAQVVSEVEDIEALMESI